MQITIAGGRILIPLLCASLACNESSQRSVDSAITVVFLNDGSDAAIRALAGTTLGIEEAESAGRLLGKRVRLEVVDVGDDDDVMEELDAQLGPGAFALVGGFSEESCNALTSLAAQRRVLFLNVGCRADALRTNTHRTVFHVEGSDSAYFSALQAARLLPVDAIRGE